MALPRLSNTELMTDAIIHRFNLVAVSALQRIAPSIVSNMTMESWVDPLTLSVVAAFRSLVLAGETTDEYQYVPATWFQHLKQHLNQTFGTRFPITLRSLPYKVTRMCPHADIAFQDKRHIEFLEFKDFHLSVDE